MAGDGRPRYAAKPEGEWKADFQEEEFDGFQDDEGEFFSCFDEEEWGIPPPVGEGEFFLEFVDMEAVAAVAKRQCDGIAALWAIGMKRLAAALVTRPSASIGVRGAVERGKAEAPRRCYGNLEAPRRCRQRHPREPTCSLGWDCAETLGGDPRTPCE